MSNKTVPGLLLMLLLSGYALTASGDAPLTFSSGERRIALIELYTSEGCSSCPPADRWLSNLKSQSGLWTEFIPVAFHVDYWDYIGWNDRFAKAGYSDRQRRFAAAGNARFVYTPGFFRNGQEWRGWQAANTVETARAPVGVLTLVVDGTDIAVHFTAVQDKYRNLTAHVAVLGLNLETQVLAGENGGKTLRHDFVALGVATAPMKKSAGAYVATAPLPEVEPIPPDRAIIAWVSDRGEQTPIQAVGGYWQSH